MIKLVAVGVLLAGTVAMASPWDDLQGEQGEQGPQGEQGIQGEQGPQGIAGANGVNGENGSNGSNGSNGYNGSDGADGTNQNSDLYNQLAVQDAGFTAMNTLELNPDHEGFSVGIGYANASRKDAGAVGIMYGHKVGTLNLGYNVKAYQVEGGHNGVGVGATIGF